MKVLATSLLTFLLFFTIMITISSSFPFKRSSGFDRLRDRIHRKRHRHQKASILNETDETFDMLSSPSSNESSRGQRTEKSIPISVAPVIHQPHHQHHHHHHHSKKHNKNRREKNEDLCLNKRKTVELNTHSHEFDPPFIVEIRCLNTPSTLNFGAIQEQTCVKGMLRCIQQYADVHVSRRSVGSMHWHPFTISDVPTGCQCMWPVDKYGHQDL